MLAGLARLLLVPPLGALSERVGRKPLLLTACVCFALLTHPFFLLRNTRNLLAAILAHLALAVIEAIFISTSIAVMTELFPTRVCYSGYPIGYNFSVTIFGGSAPFLATWLISITDNPLSRALYMIFAAAATLLTVSTVRETARTNLLKTQEHLEEVAR
jgi:MHS family proline/betaine transporter-like MFS transporter